MIEGRSPQCLFWQKHVPDYCSSHCRLPRRPISSRNTSSSCTDGRASNNPQPNPSPKSPSAAGTCLAQYCVPFPPRACPQGHGDLALNHSEGTLKDHPRHGSVSPPDPSVLCPHPDKVWSQEPSWHTMHINVRVHFPGNMTANSNKSGQGRQKKEKSFV